MKQVVVVLAVLLCSCATVAQKTLAPKKPVEKVLFIHNGPAGTVCYQQAKCPDETSCLVEEQCFTEDQFMEMVQQGGGL